MTWARLLAFSMFGGWHFHSRGVSLSMHGGDVVMIMTSYGIAMEFFFILLFLFSFEMYVCLYA